MGIPDLFDRSKNPAKSIQGIRRRLSREDWTKDGQRRTDPVLAADPIAIISYAKNHFSAQFMKQDRTGNDAGHPIHSGQNNTIAVGGYDAYFGTYDVNESTGKAAHTLIGSITPANIGITVSRDLRVDENKLTIQLGTTTTTGDPIIRTLIWERIS